MRLSFVLSVALYSLCIWLNWSDLNTARPEPNTPAEFSGFYHYLSSDALYAPALFRDLFIESVPTRGWTLPPAPYFFPDLLIYFLVLVFFKQPLAAFVAGTAFFTLSLICAGFFLRTAFPKQKHVYTGVFLAGSLLHLLIIRDLLPASFRGLIVPTFHHGASTCAFIAFALILKGLKDKQPAASFIFLFLLSWAAMLSDSVYAALVVPGTILYMGLTDAERNRRIGTVIALGLGILLGRKSVRWINNLGNLQIVTIAPEKDVLSGLTHWTSQHLADFWEIRHIIPILIAILGILLAMRFRKRPERLALLFPCAGILSILIAANIFGPQVGIGTMQDRYVFFALFATAILICSQFAKSRLVRYVFLGFLLMLTIASIRSTSEGKDHPLFTSRDCLIGLMGKADLKFGIADYWYAKPYTVLSDRKIQLNEVDLSLGPRPWINNIDRFFTPTGIPDYNFLIANNLPEKLIIQRLGAPTRRSNCGHLSIWIYDANQNPRLANLFTPHQMQIWRGALGR